MRAGWVLLAVAGALALQTTLARFVIPGVATVDLVLVAVVYLGLVGGPVTGLMAGTIAGLAQDALSSGIIGIGGLAKTVVGFIAGVLGTQFIVARPYTRFVVFFAATVLHSAIFVGLYVLLDLRNFGAPYTAVLSQSAGNAVIGVLTFQASEFLPGAWERRRSNRGMRVTRKLRD